MNDELAKLRQELEALKSEYYANNFSTSTDVNKYTRFNTRLKVPHANPLPSVCEVGEVCENGGKLYICASANNWVQT